MLLLSCLFVQRSMSNYGCGIVLVHVQNKGAQVGNKMEVIYVLQLVAEYLSVMAVQIMGAQIKNMREVIYVLIPEQDCSAWFR